MRRKPTSENRHWRDRNRSVANRNYGSAGAYSPDRNIDLEYQDMDEYSEEDWEDDFEEFDERYEAPQRRAMPTTADEWLDDDYTSDFDYDEGYDNAEIRSVRRDFDHDYDDSATGRGFRNYNDRNENGYDQSRGRNINYRDTNSSSQRESSRRSSSGFSDRGFAARGGYSGGSNYYDDYSGGSGYRGGSSSGYGNSNQYRDEEFENEERLDLQGGEPLGRSIRDRYSADLGSGNSSSRRRTIGEQDARNEQRRESRERTRHEEWDENPEDYFDDHDPETSRRSSIYQGVKTKNVKNKSMTQGGVGSGNPRGRVATEKAEKLRRRK
jgi:hypothetical protein